MRSYSVRISWTINSHICNTSSSFMFWRACLCTESQCCMLLSIKQEQRGAAVKIVAASQRAKVQMEIFRKWKRRALERTFEHILLPAQQTSDDGWANQYSLMMLVFSAATIFINIVQVCVWVVKSKAFWNTVWPFFESPSLFAFSRFLCRCWFCQVQTVIAMVSTILQKIGQRRYLVIDFVIKRLAQIKKMGWIIFWRNK